MCVFDVHVPLPVSVQSTDTGFRYVLILIFAIFVHSFFSSFLF